MMNEATTASALSGESLSAHVSDILAVAYDTSFPIPELPYSTISNELRNEIDPDIKQLLFNAFKHEAVAGEIRKRALSLALLTERVQSAAIQRSELEKMYNSASWQPSLF